MNEHLYWANALDNLMNIWLMSGTACVLFMLVLIVRRIRDYEYYVVASIIAFLFYMFAFSCYWSKIDSEVKGKFPTKQNQHG